MVYRIDEPMKSDASELEYDDYDRLGEKLFSDDGWDNRLRMAALVPGVYGWYNTRRAGEEGSEYGHAGLMVKHPESASVKETEVNAKPIDGSHVDGPAAEIGRVILSGFNNFKAIRNAPIDGF